METIQLVLPESCHKEEAEAFKEEFISNNESVINGSALLDQMEYKDWLIHTKNSRSAQTASKDWVAATTFFAIRQSDQRIVGIIDIRHNIEHEFLRQYGGHIGYAVRPSERKKGYAKEMLNKALMYAKSLGIDKVMLGCYVDNIPSIRTIETCGGKRMVQKPYADGKLMYIYWIDLF